MSVAARYGRNALLVLTAVLAPTSLAVAGDGGTGHWEGVMVRGRSTLAIALDLPADQPDHGFFTAGDLGAMDVPLSDVQMGTSTHWELVGDHTTLVFTGARSADSIRGTFQDGVTRGTFRLHRVSASVEKPYSSTDVHFTNGGISLAGTVLSPRTPGKHPAVVFLHGSGAEGRWASRFTADYMARHSIVALIYDKRGVGESSGDWRKSTLEDLAADGRAAVHLLAQRSDVDLQSLGLFGHSQGGFIAPFVAEKNPEVRWIIDADGNVGPQYEQDLFRVGTLLGHKYKGEELRNAMALYREFVDVARNGLPHTQLNADVARYGTAPWLDDLALPDEQDWIWAWYRGVGNDDNGAAWRLIDVPVLLVYGQNDEVVPAHKSIDAITGLLRSNHNSHVTVRVFDGADHTLRIAPDEPQGWPHYAPGFPGILDDWIRKR